MMFAKTPKQVKDAADFLGHLRAQVSKAKIPEKQRAEILAYLATDLGIITVGEIRALTARLGS